MVENLKNFDEQRVICQSFPFQSFPVNSFPMKATINLSKFCVSKFLTCSIRQILSGFSTVKVLRYTVTLNTPSLWIILIGYNQPGIVPMNTITSPRLTQLLG